ncbi:SDR family oxidoreductase [Spiribacter halobius]|uniref:3-oxoacyl-ACP reductase n=1 Tax=Sediminicurvatus halobius TaxID=2182432 RepID=A0A2U2N8P2_9GAMM|nr:SDR family oxidoreductase [Spiribacter halobius]PWG65442.1 3-oxoacyl-ACP reductase [Spiribacter halobius]UEX76462.1 SDR family oxidoreductase [Spiribacter halobius]
MTAKVALITGAGTGLGRAVTRALLADGYATVLAGRRRAPLEETARGVEAERVLVAPTDVSDPDAVDALFEQIRARFGRLDVLFNNAGAMAPGCTVDELDWAQWKTVVDVNLNGAFLCARGAFGLMRRQSPQGGRIINNGSISAHAPRPGSAAYTATKHAITGLTRTLSLDGRPFDIACGQIDIGNAATEMTARMPEGVPQADGSVRAEPVMDVAHVAEAVRYMAGLPLEANVQFMTVMATKMPFIGRG